MKATTEGTTTATPDDLPVAPSACDLGIWEAYRSSLSGRLGSELFQHSVGTAETAARLVSKTHPRLDGAAFAAGLLHDIAKPLSIDELLRLADEFGIVVTLCEQTSPFLLHAKVGAEIAREEYGVSDREVLDAIRWHTVGRAGMSELEMAVYLADKIEPGRSFPGVDTVRQAAERSQRLACALMAAQTISYVESTCQILDASTVEFHNWLIGENGKWRR